MSTTSDSGSFIEFAASSEVVENNFQSLALVIRMINSDSFSANPAISSFLFDFLAIFLLGLLRLLLLDFFEGKVVSNSFISWINEMRIGYPDAPQNEDSKSYTDFIVASITPHQFSGLPWYVNLRNIVREKHDLFSVLLPQNKITRGYRSTRWADSMLRMLNFIWISCFIHVLFLSDDGTCSQIASESMCLSQLSFNFFDNLCVWDDDTEPSCYFNKDLQNPSWQATLILTVVI